MLPFGPLDCLTSRERIVCVSGMSLGLSSQSRLTLPSAFVYGLGCLWDPCSAEDFEHFALYRASAAGDPFIGASDSIAQQLGLLIGSVDVVLLIVYV